MIIKIRFFYASNSTRTHSNVLIFFKTHLIVSYSMLYPIINKVHLDMTIAIYHFLRYSIIFNANH